ncbi:unnamed protein product [Nesidiocoris tenuis]|uniref:Uncharacterized protein n=1 Tax=Nesidiocoris tenuis TaxID=355587 RepID=A0A6H5GGU5_9HEMI|nr:unnamed protein product [Nesidiocoris tenuis]
MSRAEDQLEIELEFDDEPKSKEHLAIELHQPTFIYKREMSNVEPVSGGGDTEEGGKQEPEAGQDGGSAQPDDKSKTSEKSMIISSTSTSRSRHRRIRRSEICTAASKRMEN